MNDAEGALYHYLCCGVEPIRTALYVRNKRRKAYVYRGDYDDIKV